MIKLMFYWGPGDFVTRLIRRLTGGPYSHVEMQFTDGCRFSRLVTESTPEST